MKKEGIEWVHKPLTKSILHSFSVPKTPRYVEKELGIKKLKLKPFIEKNLLISLNPKASKGRLYILTNKARGMLNLPNYYETIEDTDWNLIGWIIASPRQRLVVLKTISIDPIKRTSEQIRIRASRLNCHLSRISTKGILNELIHKKLVETELIKRKRYYWISGLGKPVATKLFKSSIEGYPLPAHNIFTVSAVSYTKFALVIIVCILFSSLLI